VDWLDDLLEIVFVGHDVVWNANDLAEAAVGRALSVPDFLVGPSVDHLEPLHEEYPKVLRLIICATINRRDDSFHDLCKNVEHIDLGHF